MVFKEIHDDKLDTSSRTVAALDVAPTVSREALSRSRACYP